MHAHETTTLNNSYPESQKGHLFCVVSIVTCACVCVIRGAKHLLLLFFNTPCEWQPPGLALFFLFKKRYDAQKGTGSVAENQGSEADETWPRRWVGTRDSSRSPTI
jgi:hypothetical protein